MMKKFLGIICLLYSGIIGYVILFDKLKNFLAPGMQMYIKLSLLPLFIIGLVVFFNKNNHYKFKFSDLVLILPLILLITTNDGRLTANFAGNRMTKYNSEQNVKMKDKDTDIESKLDDLEKKDLKDENESYDFSNPYFDIEDATYSEISGYLSSSPNASKYVGKTIRVRGFAVKYEEFLPIGYIAIGRYIITCCAADASFTGFVIKYDTISKLKNDSWYEVEGVLRLGHDTKDNEMMYIDVINIKEIDSKSEEQYVYPCYTYDDTCSAVSKYDLN